MDDTSIKSVICLSTQPWEDVGWTNKRQVMSRLADKVPVLYVFAGSSLAGAILAGLYPAWRMSRTSPGQALRQD